jgi:hypothetical protein
LDVLDIEILEADREGAERSFKVVLSPGQPACGYNQKSEYGQQQTIASPAAHERHHLGSCVNRMSDEEDGRKGDRR